MRILILGGRGLVGRQLAAMLVRQKHAVTVLARRVPEGHTSSSLRYLAADTTRPGPWQDEVHNSEAVVNLVGQSIFHYWSQAYKEKIYRSRVESTRNLVEALPTKKGMVLCNASAVGYYGDRHDDRLSEREAAGQDFLATVCVDWEAEALKAEGKGARVILARFGVVLAREGGALAQMLPAYRFCLGGPLGSGKQWFSWIHIADLLAAIDFALTNPAIAGPVNFSAPNPVRNAELAKELGNLVHRPAFLAVPAFLLSLALGEFGQTLLASQRAIPEKLSHFGFNFQYPELTGALADLLAISK